jgi:hypothetical protein
MYRALRREETRSMLFGFEGLHVTETVDDIMIAKLLAEYVKRYPAFRSRGVGAPNSYARLTQENDIALEDAAKEALKQYVLGKSSRRDVEGT